MKKFLLQISTLCLAVILLCCSCGFLGEQEFTCNVDEVKSVQIAIYNGYNENKSEFEYTVLCEISDYSYFINRLKSVKTSVHWGDPRIIESGYTVVRIEYLNGDYDFINDIAQIKTRGEKTNSGYLTFDKDQFNALISEYLPK